MATPMHKILLTGSNGLLGQKLVHLLSVKGEVTLLATSTGPDRITTASGYEYRTLDITDESAVMKVVTDFAPTAIINTAAMTNVDACEADEEGCRRLNVDAVKYLLKAAEEVGAKLVHLSTDFVFNGEDGPYSEDDLPDPLSIYAQSKYESEGVLMRSDYTDWVIARTIIVYGVSEAMSRNNIVLWARQALLKGDEMNIVNDQWRSPTLAEDLAMGCWLAVEKDAEGIYHLSGPETYSIIELVYAVAEFYGFSTANVKPISSATLSQAAKRPPRTGFILDKAKKELGYAPRTLHQGLAMIDEQDPLPES